MCKKVVLKMQGRMFGSKFDGDKWSVEFAADRVPTDVLEALAEVPVEKDEWGLPIYKKEQIILDWIDTLSIEEQEPFMNAENEIFPFLQIDTEDWIRQEYKMQELRRTRANVIEVNFGQKNKALSK